MNRRQHRSTVSGKDGHGAMWHVAVFAALIVGSTALGVWADRTADRSNNPAQSVPSVSVNETADRIQCPTEE